MAPKISGLLACLLSVGLAPLALAQAPAPATALVDVSGRAEVAPAGTDRWRSLTSTSGLGPGDRLRTAPGAAVEFRIGTALFSLAAGSDLVLGPADDPRSVQLLAGEVWAERRSGAGQVTLRGGTSQGQFGRGRIHLERGREDAWAAPEGELELAIDTPDRPRRRLVAGQAIQVDRTGFGSTRKLPPAGPGAGSLDAAALTKRRETVSRLLAAQRRLVQLAQDRGETRPEWASASLQLGEALANTRQELGDLIDRRALGAASGARDNRLPGAARLLSEMDRALGQHAALLARLDWADRGAVLVKRDPPSVATGPDSEEAGGASGGSDNAAVSENQRASRFLRRYTQALQRFQRILGRAVLLKGKNTTLGELAAIRRRVVSGYRQAEAVVLRAQAEARRTPRAERSDRLKQADRSLSRDWNRAGRDFRIAQNLLRQAFVLKKMNKPGPGPDQGPDGGPTGR